MKNIPLALTFDDVLLIPGYSEVVPTEVDTTSFFSSKIKLKIPILSSAMDTVSEGKMGVAMAQAGGMAFIHKNLNIQKQAEEVEMVKKNSGLIGAAVGATGDFFERAQILQKAGVDILVVDTAHGHSKRVLEAVRLIKKKLKMYLIAGNIATYEGAKALALAGVDAVKVGIGPGSICTTRIISGCGVPQIYAIQEVVRALKNKKIPIIADGGIKHSGDVVKALAFGASFVMIGSLFAGTDEAPGEIFEDSPIGSGKKYKLYRGMGSLGAMNEGSKDRYGQEKVIGGKLVPEGVEARVPYKGSVINIIEQLTGGLRSGMGYVGAKNIKELQKKAKFVQITSAGFKESHVHDVQIVKKAPNY